MFEDFLREYIKDLIDCSDIEYNLTSEDIEDVVCTISNNEELWNIIDGCIYFQLDLKGGKK